MRLRSLFCQLFEIGECRILHILKEKRWEIACKEVCTPVGIDQLIECVMVIGQLEEAVYVSPGVLFDSFELLTVMVFQEISIGHHELASLENYILKSNEIGNLEHGRDSFQQRFIGI